MRREVGVNLNRQLDIREDLVVVGPRWRGEVELFVLRVEMCEEECSEVDSTGT